MATYNSIISRSASNPPAMASDDASALIPEDVSKEIIKGAVEKSSAMQLFQHRTMSRKQQRLPVLALKPTAYWVNGDTGLKQTTEINWTNKYINAEEVATIVPIPEALLDDVDYDLWTEAKPELEEAIAALIDDTIFFGTNAPSTFPTNIVAAATAAGNAVTAGTSTVDVADDINNVMGAVEADGYDVNGFVCRTQLKATLRGLRSTTKELIWQPGEQGAANGTFGGTIWGEKAYFNKLGLSGFATGSGNAHLICGDWRQGIIGIRQDITYKMLDQAVLTDANGNILFNLAQQDMVAMRVVCRMGWQVPNPPTRQQATEASRWPFGVLKQA